MQTCCLAADIINANVSATRECEKAKGAVDWLFSGFDFVCSVPKICGTGQFLDVFKIKHSRVHELENSVWLICMFFPS